MITADEAPRGGKVTALKTNVNKALLHCPHEVKCLVVRRTGGEVAWEAGRDHWLHELAADVAADCPPEPMGAEDPLFILYTSRLHRQAEGGGPHHRRLSRSTPR